MATESEESPLNEGWTYFDRISRAAAGIAVLDFYAQRYQHSSRQVWQQRIEAGLIRLDGQSTTGATPLHPGQLLSYARPPWREPPAPVQFALTHSDGDLVAVAKPAGLPVLPGGQFLSRTLLHLVRRRFGARLSPLHRLGRGTSGLVLFAASPRARQALSHEFRTGSIRKTYRALVEGTGMPETFAVEVPIGRVPYQPVGYLYAASDAGVPARSECRVCWQDSAAGRTLLEVVIPTGRPHQIRIHLAAAGYPLIGDPLYVAGGTPRPATGGRAALPGDCGYHLHAQRLGFRHPASGGWHELYCRAPSSLRWREGE